MPKLFDIIGCEREGMSIGLNLSFEFEEACPKRVDRLITNFWDYLSARGYSLTAVPAAGTLRGGEIQNFDGGEDIEYHEATHQWLEAEHLRKMDLSFSEGVAYGFEAFRFDSSRVGMIEDSFYGLCVYHAWATHALANGGLGDNKNLLNKYIAAAGFSTYQDNWATFMEVVKNLRYLPLVLNILRRFDDEKEGRKIFSRAALIISSDGLESGLDYLTGFTREQSNGCCPYVFDREGRNGLRERTVNALPFCVPDLFMPKGVATKVFDRGELFSLELRTFDVEIKNEFVRLIDRDTSFLEKELGSELLILCF
jgi:hypothetical protein